MFTRGKCTNVFVGDVCAIVVSEGSSGPLVKVSNTRLIFLVAGGYAVACTTRRVFFHEEGLVVASSFCFGPGKGQTSNC